MTKGREAAVGALAGFALAKVAELSARALAQVHAHVAIQLFSDGTTAECFRLIPAILVAGACLHAIAFHSRRALYLVLFCTVPGDAFWSYRGELGFHDAIAAKRWTAAALSSGLAGFASIVLVMLGIPIAFLLASWLEKRSAPRQKVVPRRQGRAWLIRPLLDGSDPIFACPVCTASVNFGASHCDSCEARFEYLKHPGATAS